MRRHVDTRTFVIGAVIAALVLLAAGAVRQDSSGEVGRFQVACTDSMAYLVDTTTGQVWRSVDRQFSEPKLTGRPAATADSENARRAVTER